MRPAIVCVILALAAPAVAEDDLLDVPTECRPLVPEARETPLFWDQWMSLAACMQDGSVDPVTKVEDVAPMVDRLMLSITPSILLYREVLESAPRTMKLRAAYHVGALAVAMMTRARVSIGRGDPKLGRELEPLLETAREMARVAFESVVQEAARDRDLRVDPVNRYMIRAAERHLQALEREKPRIQTVRA